MESKFKKVLDKIRNIIKFENLRTLMLFGDYDASFVQTFSDLSENAKSLRVVYLSTWYYPVESLLPSMSNLVHLRYLRLVSARYGCKEHLPRNISRFYQLRVLDIAGWYGSHSLLGDMTNLVKLRHFLSNDEKVNSNICNVGKLHSLQELQRFEVRKDGSGFELRELGELEELGGSLGICNLENALENEAHDAKLLHKTRLQKLALSWEKGRSNTNSAAEDQLLENLQPHGNLHELFIAGHGGFSCPTWLGTNLSTKSLEALHLESIDWQFLPPLGELYLVREAGEYFGCTTGPSFHNLKRLELIGLPRFGRWVANEVCPWYFSLIEVLVVKDCAELTELPFSSYTCYPSERDLNVTWFPRLREIKIENCPKLLSLPPMPYSNTLCDATLDRVGRGMAWFSYSNQSCNLRIEGNADLCSLDETVLAFDNLTQLQELRIINCPPLSEKHLQILTSLKFLIIKCSSICFLPFERNYVKWQLSVNCLQITRWGASGKELTRLLSHLPELSSLYIQECEKITRLGVEAQQQQTLTLPASSAVKLEDTHGTNQPQEIAEEVVDDGLLIIPAHLSDCLQLLCIYGSSELILTAQNTGPEGGGLHAMRSLEKIMIGSCPKFLTAYKASDLSPCYPFPSSLPSLTLLGSTETLGPLSNLTSLQELTVKDCGEGLRCEGMLHLLTHGQLKELGVYDSPKFFVGWNPSQALQGEEEQPSSKLQELATNDIEGVLVTLICNFLSSSLTKLYFRLITEVERFTNEQEEALSLLTSLQVLQFWKCDKLQCLPQKLHKLTSLERLEIKKCPAIRSLHKNGLPSSLQELAVVSCINLRCLPAGLHKLANLKRLHIHSCPDIRFLPKNGLPSSLQQLDVSVCENEKLKQRCRRLVGTIPPITIYG